MENIPIFSGDQISRNDDEEIDYATRATKNKKIHQLLIFTFPYTHTTLFVFL